MAGRDVLRSLLFGLGSGLSTYGKGKAEQIQLTEEEKIKQRQKDADEKRKAQAAQQENEIATVRKIETLRGINPELADRLGSEVVRLKLNGLPVEPFDDGTIKMYQQKMESEKAQSILDQIGGQGAVNDVTMRTGVDAKEAAPIMQEQSFNQEGQGPQPVERMIRGAIDKIRAIQADKALNQKRLTEITAKPDAGSTLSDQELWTQFNAENAREQAQYDADLNRYQNKLAEYEAEKNKLATSTSPSDRQRAATLKAPNPPLYPTRLSAYKKDGEGTFRLWAERKRREFGGVNKPIEFGGTPQEKPQPSGTTTPNPRPMPASWKGTKKQWLDYLRKKGEIK